MSQSIGQKLAAARRRRDLSVEDVAHATRIPPKTLVQLESDDYSTFDNLTYARSFLAMYSQHLDVDASDVLKELSAQSEDEEDESVDTPETRSFGTSFGEEPGRNPALTRALLILIVCAIPGMYFLGRMHGVRTASRIKSTLASQTTTPVDPAAEEATTTEPEPEERRPAAQNTADPASTEPAQSGSTKPGSPVEVRRPDVLDPNSGDDGRPEVRTVPRAVRVP